MSELKKGAVIVLALIFVLGLKIGMRYLFSEWSVDESRGTGWSADFRTGFLESCTDEAVKSIASAMKLDLKDNSDETAAKTIANDYCDCMATDVEKHKILLTKFNQYRGIAVAEEENEKAISSYMTSNDGKTAISECMQKAATD